MGKAAVHCLRSISIQTPNLTHSMMFHDKTLAVAQLCAVLLPGPLYSVQTEQTDQQKVSVASNNFTSTHLASSACDSCPSHASVGRTDMDARDIVSGTRYCSGMTDSPGWRRHSAACSHSCWGRWLSPWNAISRAASS